MVLVPQVLSTIIIISSRPETELDNNKYIILIQQKNNIKIPRGYSQSFIDENHDIANAMSPSRADPLLPWLGVFKCLIQCYCTGWGYLNIYISITALAGGI